MSPGGSGYFTCIQNMKLVTNKFKSGGLHEKHVVATWNLRLLNVEFALYHRLYAYSFDVAPRYFENLCSPVVHSALFLRVSEEKHSLFLRILGSWQCF